MTDRKEFEAWILDRPNADLQCIKLDVDDHYDEYWVNLRWICWQAAKAHSAKLIVQALANFEIGIKHMRPSQKTKTAIAELKKALMES